MTKQQVAAVLQPVGLLVAAAGLGLIWPPIGVVALGAAAVVLGIALERETEGS